jgi:hypothetical protein
LQANTVNLPAQYNPASPVPQMPQPPNPYGAMPTYGKFGLEPPASQNHAYPGQRQQNTGMEHYERDRMETARMNEELLRMVSESREISYGLPSFAAISETGYYRQAAETLLDMLKGKIPLSLKDAVFTVENAYFEGKLDKMQYGKHIDELVSIARSKAIEDRYSWNNNTAKNVMFFRLMTDTLKINLPLRERSVTSYPMQYDFEDITGQEDWTKMFVSKLLYTHSGQCHSLPLLYLILCEATGTEAYLACSPSHSYVKFKDETGSWHNVELTGGRFTTDAFITGSGFVTAEAIKSGLYMRPLSRRETVSACLTDLIDGYVHKYGYDDFMNRYADSVLKYDETNRRALMIKSNYTTLCVLHAVRQIGGQPDMNTIRKYYPRLYEMIEESKELHRKIDALGYREMPEAAYREWLEAANREKERREHDRQYERIIQLLD